MTYLFAAYRDGFWNVLLTVHILGAVAAFGPALAFTSLTKAGVNRGGEAGAELVGLAKRLNQRVVIPALVLTLLAGISLVIHSSKLYGFDEPWVSAAFTIVIVVGLVARFVVSPSLDRLSAAMLQDKPDADAIRKARGAAAGSTGLYHLGLGLLIILMVFRPGS